MERDLFGRTPLHAACIQSDPEALLIFANDFDYAARDRYGLTALDYAVVGGYQACVEALHRAAPDAFLQLLAPKNSEEAPRSEGVVGVCDDGLLVAELNPRDKAPAANLTLSADRTKVSSNVGWGSVRSTVGIRLGDVGRTFYFEARVDSGGIIQIGWATKRCRMSETDGIGDDRHSWAWDGFRKRIWHAGGSIIFHHTPLWKMNDVVTTYATIIEVITAQDDQEGKKERKFARVQMGARVNGKDVGVESTVQLPIESEDDFLYPGVSLVRAEATTLNFGYQPFTHPMDRWVSVAEAAPSWEQVREHVPFVSVPYPAASPVHIAAATGHTAILEFLFDKAKPDALVDLLLTKDSEGRIPFHYACRYSGNVDALRLFLAQEAKLNSQKKWKIGQVKIHDKFGRTALVHACDQSHPEIVQFLLESGADVNEVDREGVSVLYHAIDHDCAPIVSLLMDHGVDIEQRDKLRDTALTFAAKNGALECIKLLVSRGADTSARDAEGSTVLLASLINGYAPLVKHLLTAGISEAHERNHEGDSAFLTTARTSSVECAELLLAHGASLNDKDEHGTNALMYAASGKNPEMVRWLIGKGLDVNEANSQLQTAMSFAASNGPVENLRILIEHGAKANHPRIDGRTPFLIAALCGREEICRFLLFNGHASLNEVDMRGNTALLLACNTASTSCARFLLEHGADPNDRDRSGTSPLLFACSEGDLELVQLLINHGADPRVANFNGCTPLLAAGLAGKMSTIQYLLSNGYSSIDERDRVGGSVLLHSCREGSVECLEYLLSQGASLDETDVRGATPLIYATTADNVEVMEWLLDVKKVDVDRKAQDWTAINYAVSRGRVRATNVLLAHGAQLTAIDSDPLTSPLAQACSSGLPDMLDLLLARGFSFADDAERRTCVEATLGTGSLVMCRHLFNQLVEIDLSQPSDEPNSLLSSVVDLLFQALADNNTVERLNLNGQSLADDTLPCLIEMLSQNRHLTWLGLDFNRFTLDGTEKLVDAVRLHNRSLLSLDIDLDCRFRSEEEDEDSATAAEDDNDSAQQEEEKKARKEERQRRIERLKEMVAYTLLRARQYRREVVTTAIHMLTAARLLLQPHPVTQFGDDSPLAALPVELLEAIVAGIDTNDVLDHEERRRILAFALDTQGTQGKTREQFLRACVTSLTWWPDEAERKRKRDLADELARQSKKQDRGDETAQQEQPNNTDSRWSRFLRFFR